MSASKPSNKAFYRAFGVVVAGLLIGILALALLVTTTGPRVRQVIVQNLSDNGVASVDQGLNVFFDRPIKSTDFASAVEVQPKTDFTATYRNQQLNITFNQNLLSNTNYVLTISPQLEDDLGKQMKQAYTYEFSTAQPSFTYLERNYGSGLDRIIERAPLSQENHPLFWASRIKAFARNDKYLAAVVMRPDNADELHVVDLRTHNNRTVDLPYDAQISSLKVSPVNNQLAFVNHVLPKAGSNKTSDDFPDSNKLYRYDIDGDQLQPVDTLSEMGNVDNALYSRDGQALLYRTLDGEYYLTGAAQTTEPTLLGSYKQSGGFDQTNTKLAFKSGSSDAAIYDAQAKEQKELPNISKGGSISAPTFLHNSADLIYLWDPFNAQEGDTTQVYIADADGEIEEQVGSSQLPMRFFDEPVISYDDRYVLVETTSESRTQLDNYTGNRKPEKTQLMLYDRFDGKVIESDTHGVDPVWNR